MSPAFILLLFAAIFAQAALGSEVFGPSMAGASNTIGNPNSGLVIEALDNSTLTSFLFTNQGNADTVELTTQDLGSVLDSISVPSGTNPFTASVSWSLTSGDVYWLVSVDRSNGTFVSSSAPGATYPQVDSDISVNESEFGGTEIGVGNLQLTCLDFLSQS